MPEILSSYNYVKKPDAKPNEVEKAVASILTPNSKTDNTNTAQNKPNNFHSATTCDSTNDSYTSDIKEIFNTLKDMKELQKFNKFIQCFKTIAPLSKKANDPTEKMLIMSVFDNLAMEFNSTDNE